MLLRRTIGTGCLTAVLLVSLATPRETRAAAPPLLVRDTETQLVAAGCERVELADNKAVQAAQALDWQAVVPSDATGEALLFCPPAMAGGVRPLGDGQVAGYWDNIKDMTWGDWAQGAIVKVLTGKSTFEYFGGKASAAAAEATAGLFEMLKQAGNELLRMLAHLIPPLLTQYEFISSKIVRQTWPIVLGVANAGFLLALVFIALLTVLRLDIGGGVYKLLPRLLIAALLVNFSLVIAGAILDLSRVVMAVVMAMMRDPSGTGLQNLDQLPDKIVHGADAYQLFFSISNDSNLDWAGWEKTVGALIGAITMWAMVIAVLIVVIGLLIRYAVLLLLLIVSPLAYVFIALPGAGGLAKKWWSTFLRYVIYGPVVLMLLIMAVSVTGKFNPFKEVFGTESANRIFVSLINTAVFCTFIIFAALAGRTAGIIGSAMTISLAAGAGRRVRGAAYRGAARTGKAAARGTAKGLYIGTGARRATRQARDFGRELFRPLRKGLGLGEYSKWDQRGRPKPGEVTAGMRAGRGAARVMGMDPEAQRVVKGVGDANRRQATAPPGGFNPILDRGLTIDNLMRGEAAQTASAGLIKDLNDSGNDGQKQAFAGALGTTDSLGKEQVTAVVESGNKDWIRNVVNNVNIMAATTSGQKSQLMKVAVNLGDPSLARDVFRAMDRAKRAQEKKT